VGREGVEPLVEEVPARRWDEPYFGAAADGATTAGATTSPPRFTVAPGAREEAAARRLGEELRTALPESTTDVLSTLRRELPVESWGPLASFLGVPRIATVAARESAIAT